MKYEFEVELKKTNSRKRKLEQNETRPKISRDKKQLILAHQIVKYMEENNISTLGQMSRMANVSLARLSQILGILLLTPQVQESLLKIGNGNSDLQ